MKIGILTFTNGTNYGQRLQNYALQTVLEEKGHEAYTIRQSWPRSLWKSRVKEWIKKLCDPKNGWKKLRKERAFDQFNARYIKFYKKTISFEKDNRWIAKEFDKFVAGSDQIWNPNSPLCGGNFFLSFAEKCQRNAYAPSFSVESIPIKKKDIFASYLNGFHGITVREHAGAKIVKELTGKDVEVVLDPVLLLDRKAWEQIKEIPCMSIPEEGYILTLFLGTPYIEECRHIAHRSGKKLVVLKQNSICSPAGFLYLVDNAALILTDSFHAAAVSTVFSKPFIVFARKGNGMGMGSRFDTLFSTLKISGRRWEEIKHHPESYFTFDYAETERILNKERIRSLGILEKMLIG